MIIILILFLLLINNSGYSHEYYGLNNEWSKEYILIIEPFLEKEYNIKLQKNILIYNAKDNNEYKRILIKYKVKNYKSLIKNSYAVTSQGNMILINMQELKNDKHHFYFVLTHEMAHQFQFQKYGNILKLNKYWIEEDANKKAYKLTQYN